MTLRTIAGINYLIYRRIWAKLVQNMTLRGGGGGSELNVTMTLIQFGEAPLITTTIPTLH